jgi:ATP-dependent RNA helicase RhlE
MPPDIRKLADSILKDPVTVQIGKIAPAKTVSHAFYPVPANLKKSLLMAMLKQTPTDRVLIFTRTKYRARNLARDLEKRGYRAAALQGNMSQNQRQKAIDGFRNRKYDILAATDVAARGIDVSEISHVINFDIPNTVDAYTHRIGRTGRAHRSGEAYTFAGKEDEQMIRGIERLVGTRIERRRLPNFNYGGFVPENQFEMGHSILPGKKPSRHKPSHFRSKGNGNGNGHGKGNGYRNGNGHRSGNGPRPRRK